MRAQSHSNRRLLANAAKLISQRLLAADRPSREAYNTYDPQRTAQGLSLLTGNDDKFNYLGWVPQLKDDGARGYPNARLSIKADSLYAGGTRTVAVGVTSFESDNRCSNPCATAR